MIVNLPFSLHQWDLHELGGILTNFLLENLRIDHLYFPFNCLFYSHV